MLKFKYSKLLNCHPRASKTTIDTSQRGIRRVQRQICSTYNQSRSFGLSFPVRSGVSDPQNGRYLRMGPHVKEALANGEPIVALESTVITHGMPEPENLKLALELEQIVKMEGSTGATVAIVEGQLVIGLTPDEIEHLSKRSLSKAMKASRRNIPIAIGTRRSAGTTVAGTMAIVNHLNNVLATINSSNRQGQLVHPIRIFATGGTGGVHRTDGSEHHMDISADLFEFSRSPLAVVSSGFKSFLDLRKSLEYLETIGCTVISLNQQNPGENCHQHGQLFPAFYCTENDENIYSPFSVKSIEEAASILFECLEGGCQSEPIVEAPDWISATNRTLASGNARCGALLAVPIPKEFSLDGMLELGLATGCGHDKLSAAMKQVIDQVDSSKSLQGFEKTPLILDKLNQVTDGKSLKANLELLKNNARVGARLAFQYQLIRQEKIANSRSRYEHNDFVGIRNFSRDSLVIEDNGNTTNRKSGKASNKSTRILDA